MRGFRRIAATVSAAFMLGWAGAAGADPLTIRVGWVVTPGHLAPLEEALGAKHPELFRHLGRSYVLQAVHFQGTSPEIQAHAINELEIASFSTAAKAWPAFRDGSGCTCSRPFRRWRWASGCRSAWITGSPTPGG